MAGRWLAFNCVSIANRSAISSAPSGGFPFCTALSNGDNKDNPMLSRLIYASSVAKPLDPAGINLLLSQARLRNGLRGVTGMLVFDSKYFLQAIEGSQRELSSLYSLLVNDPRHCDLMLLKFGRIYSRLFPSWNMAFAPADAAHRAVFGRRMAGSRFDPYSLDGTAAESLLIDFMTVGADLSEALARD